MTILGSWLAVGTDGMMGSSYYGPSYPRAASELNGRSCSEILYELASKEMLPRLQECRDELQRLSHQLFRISTYYEGLDVIKGYQLVTDFDCKPGNFYNDTNLFSSTNLSAAQGCASALSELGEAYTAIRVSSNLVFEDYYKVVLSPK